jgi:hypothetical protein
LTGQAGPIPSGEAVPYFASLIDSDSIIERFASLSETVQNLGVITPHFETDDVPAAPQRRNPC